MDRIKDILVIAIAGLALMLSTNTVRADSMTPKEFFDRLANIPVKVENHISMEITKTKNTRLRTGRRSRQIS